MNPTILLVDDNPKILFNLELILKFNDYIVIPATSAKQAIKILSDRDKAPDLIISDIMMPEMDGYEFFEKVSNDPRWSHIPFIFLTAKSTPEDVRLGKILGADDYITKPYKKEDVLASIAGKFSRIKKNERVKQKIDEELTVLKEIAATSSQIRSNDEPVIFWLLWDEIQGPTLKDRAPKDKKPDFSVQDVGAQLFHGTVCIYGHNTSSDAQGMLLHINNINRDSYMYFDSFNDKTVRGGKRQFMLAAIASKLNYLESLKIKEIFKEISIYVKNAKEWDINEYWKKTVEILSKSQIFSA